MLQAPAFEEVDSTLRAMIQPGMIVTGASEAAGTMARTSMIMPPDGKTSGWSRGASIRRGFSVVFLDVHQHQDERYAFQCGDHLKLHCKLNGTSLISGKNSESKVEAGRLSFLVQPADSIKYEEVKSDTHTRAVTMVCTRDFLSDLIPMSNALPSILLEYMKAPVTQFCHRDAPLLLPMRAIAEDMLQLRSDRLADLLLEAKALELLYLSLRQIGSIAESAPVKPRDRKKVQDLCALLGSREGAVMSIAQLCRTLAWNETQMMESFKQETGMTISNYRLRLRMDEALMQLRTTDRSITEISFDAGYEHSSNFATAFKRTFGFSPKAARAHYN